MLCPPLSHPFLGGSGEMEIVEVVQKLEPGLPDLSGLIHTREWVIGLIDDLSSVLEAIAVHDNRWDVLNQ